MIVRKTIYFLAGGYMRLLFVTLATRRTIAEITVYVRSWSKERHDAIENIGHYCVDQRGIRQRRMHVERERRGRARTTRRATRRRPNPLPPAHDRRHSGPTYACGRGF